MDKIYYTHINKDKYVLTGKFIIFAVRMQVIAVMNDDLLSSILYYETMVHISAWILYCCMYKTLCARPECTLLYLPVDNCAQVYSQV